jgi:hypothetical protein
MRGLIALFLFAVVWLLFANFEFQGSDKITDYSAMPTRTLSDHLPLLMPLNPTVYRIGDNQVVSNTMGYSERYKDCTIFDKKNWVCASGEDSATFGFRLGVYFMRGRVNETSDFFKDTKSISRFSYILLGCRWDFSEGLNSFQWVACAFRPFIQ